MINVEAKNETIQNRPSVSNQVLETVILIKQFMATRRGYLKSIDLWTLIKAYYPENELVLYWKLRNKERHGIPVAISEALKNDPQIVRICRGKKEVYYKLDSAEDVI